MENGHEASQVTMQLAKQQAVSSSRLRPQARLKGENLAIPW